MDVRRGGNMRSKAKSGWFNDSFRHYLAAKGIGSKNKLYFQNGPDHASKGNRDPGRIKRAYAKGWSKAQLIADADLRRKFNISLDELKPKQKDVLPEDFTSSQERLSGSSVESLSLPEGESVPSSLTGSIPPSNAETLPEAEDSGPQLAPQPKPVSELDKPAGEDVFRTRAVPEFTGTGAVEVSAVPEVRARGDFEPLNESQEAVFAFSKKRFEKRFNSGEDEARL